MAIPAVIAHGGAGPGPERNENVKIAVREASKILESGGSAIDAAVEACVILEDDPLSMQVQVEYSELMVQCFLMHQYKLVMVG